MSDLRDAISERWPTLIDDAKRHLRAAAVEPCARCGTEGGPIRAGKARPYRLSGARYGIDGDLCERCHGTLRERERRMRGR